MTKQEQKTPIRIQFAGYGHYKIFMTYRRKEIHCTTSCMPDIDDYKDDNERRHNKGYKSLRNTVIRANQ